MSLEIYWPCRISWGLFLLALNKAILGIFYWPGAIGTLLVSSPVSAAKHPTEKMKNITVEMKKIQSKFL